MIALVLFAALVALSSAQFQPQPSGRILESPIPALCAQSEYLLPFSSLLIRVARISGHKDRPKRRGSCQTDLYNVLNLDNILGTFRLIDNYSNLPRTKAFVIIAPRLVN